MNNYLTLLTMGVSICPFNIHAPRPERVFSKWGPWGVMWECCLGYHNINAEWSYKYREILLTVTETQISPFLRNFHHCLPELEAVILETFCRVSDKNFIKINDDIFVSVILSAHDSVTILALYRKWTVRSQLARYKGFVLLTWIIYIPTWISNPMPNKVWDEITYRFPNFNVCTVEV